jgi:UDP-N-acetylglucosamine 1-carboxyvinyltransferase
MIGRCGEAVMAHPGGCVIGKRPIDLHLMALGKMGVVFEEESGRLHARAESLHGSEIELPIRSVGATENVILAGVAAEGDTVLRGAAAEPEVSALCRYLRQCGAHIEGDGTDRILIRGGRRLCGTDFRVDADRIVAGTYLLGCLGIGGSVFLEDAPGNQMEAVIDEAKRAGALVCSLPEGIYVQAPGRPSFSGKLSTAVYPGYPTDLQSAALAAAAVGDGELLIEETVFEDRFRIVKELKKLGADIALLDERTVRVRGVERLSGARVRAEELRGGAALVLAGLMAGGETVVEGCSYIDRGYENICRDFKELGARVISV